MNWNWRSLAFLLLCKGAIGSVQLPAFTVNIGSVMKTTVTLTLATDDLHLSIFGIDDMEQVKPSPYFVILNGDELNTRPNIEIYENDTTQYANKMVAKRSIAYELFSLDIAIAPMETQHEVMWVVAAVLKSDGVKISVYSLNVSFIASETEIEISGVSHEFSTSDLFATSFDLMTSPQPFIDPLNVIVYMEPSIGLKFEAVQILPGSINYKSFSDKGLYQMAKFDRLYMFAKIKLSFQYKVLSNSKKNFQILMECIYTINGELKSYDTVLQISMDKSLSEIGQESSSGDTEEPFLNSLETTVIVREEKDLIFCDVNKNKQMKYCNIYECATGTIIRFMTPIVYILAYEEQQDVLYGMDTAGRYIMFQSLERYKYISVSQWGSIKGTEGIDMARNYSWINPEAYASSPLFIIDAVEYKIESKGLRNMTSGDFVIRFIPR